MKALFVAESEGRLQTPAQRQLSRLLMVSFIAGAWSLWYAVYRAYYGFGGTVGMFGTPRL